MHLEKNRTYACTFPVQRKEINVVKVHFTMRFSSRKLSNDKVITTACNFWRQIACYFRAMSGNILFLGNKIFEIPPFFQTRPGDLGKKAHACSLRFSALKVFSVLTRGNESLLKCLNVSRTVSHLIMRNNKPTFAWLYSLPRTQARSSGFESDWDFGSALGIMGKLNQICKSSHFSRSPFPASFAFTFNVTTVHCAILLDG